MKPKSKVIIPICRNTALILVLSAVLAGAAERSALEWLDTMNRAFRTLDYDGVFSYQSGTDLTTLRVVHVVIDGIEHERLVHLDGRGANSCGAVKKSHGFYSRETIF
ncbi:MAG: hypothetical protein Ct9H300mP8_13030 [Gammaproteobacteria bacterium]|nr:MAG: hypothetical protein Ct9H300mP8_13030 [Gammaproteobacteria bacterium]